MSNWKLKRVIFIVIFLLMLSGCGNTDELEDTISSQDGQITELDERIAELEGELNEVQARYAAQGYVIVGLENEIEEMLPYRTEREILLIQDLMENFEQLYLGDILGGTPEILDEDDISFIGSNTVIAKVWWTHAPRMLDFATVTAFPTIVILSFEQNWDEGIEFQDRDFESSTISWTVLAYDHTRLRILEDRNTSRLTDLETVTIRFYYYGIGAQGRVSWEDAWPYRAEEISGEYLREEFIRLMRYHSGINIWDLWHEDGVMYVDLSPLELREFYSTKYPAAIRNHMLLRTLTSFPDVQYIRVLIDGRMFVGMAVNPDFTRTFNVAELQWEVEEDQ